MNRRDLLSEDGQKVYGECFLCCGESYLTPGVDSAGKAVYTCFRCGGMNTPKRIENGLKFDGQPLRR